jgi:hypothetical protein
VAAIQQQQLETKISQPTIKLLPRYKRRLESVAALNLQSALTICNYMAALKIEVNNPTDHYRGDIINILTMLTKKTGHRNFKDLTCDDIVSFLQSFEKPEEADPLHK